MFNWQPYSANQANADPSDISLFEIHLTVHYQPQSFLYTTGFWYLLKWALVQYVAVWLLVNWTVKKLESLVYGEFMVPSVWQLSDMKLLAQLKDKKAI